MGNLDRIKMILRVGRRATKLRGQVRSQVQLGNEAGGRVRAEDSEFSEGKDRGIFDSINRINTIGKRQGKIFDGINGMGI